MSKRGKRGFTLVEMLVATLILVLVSLCVMLGVNSSQTIYRESLFVSESETLCDTLNTAMGDVLHYALVDGTEGGGDVSFTNNNYGVENGRFYVKDGLLYMTPDGSAVTEGTKLLQLLGKSGYSGLRVKDFTIAYIDGVFSGGYTVYHPSQNNLSKAMTFTFRTLG